MLDVKVKIVFKEVVDVVVNSFVKYFYGYGWGNYFKYIYVCSK